MKTVNTEQEITPRDQFKAIQEQAKIDNAKAMGVDDEEDFDNEVESTADDLGMDDDFEEEDEPQTMESKKELDEESTTKPVDKNLGERKIEVTREQHQGQKDQANAIEALRALKGANQEHLKPEDLKAMKLALSMLESGKLKDPVLIHLLKEKVELSKQYIKATIGIKELQRRLMNEISAATNAVVKCKGAIENQDRQILNLVKSNPGLLE